MNLHQPSLHRPSLHRPSDPPTLLLPLPSLAPLAANNLCWCTPMQTSSLEICEFGEGRNSWAANSPAVEAHLYGLVLPIAFGLQSFGA